MSEDGDTRCATCGRDLREQSDVFLRQGQPLCTAKHNLMDKLMSQQQQRKSNLGTDVLNPVMDTHYQLADPIRPVSEQ